MELSRALPIAASLHSRRPLRCVASRGLTLALPQPPSAWEGVRKADRFGPGCMQFKLGERLPWTREFMVQNEISEDCLYLNIWAPQTGLSAKLPVIVFIHGGGFSEGSGAVQVYWGANLAAKGAVVVTINYRLGVFGFLAYPELTAESEHHSSGNYGLLDQIAALKWGQRKHRTIRR